MVPAPGRTGFDFVIAANRLPVDQHVQPDGSIEWRTSPGGLVTAMESVMHEREAAWVGWAGFAGEAPEPFDDGPLRLCPVPLSTEEVADYYEGFSNGTLWPLYHDVIVPPEYHRKWWNSYVAVNRRFAAAAAEAVAEGGTVWVHDYQLQLVPAALRMLRPDVRIGFFNHIPFPPPEIFSQLPWRRQVIEGLTAGAVKG